MIRGFDTVCGGSGGRRRERGRDGKGEEVQG
jgi:hypothetical protein